jgi:DNA-binding transcriptional ArsR family regulator
MVHQKDALDRTFQVLADPTRRRIIARLAQGEATVSELAEPHRMSLPAVMKHLAKLSDADLIVRRKRGRVVTCALKAERLRDAQRWLDQHLRFWTERLDALDRYLKEGKERRT